VKTEKMRSEVLVHSAAIINREINLIMGAGGEARAAQVLD